MRRLLNQAANAAVKTKGSIFQNLYRRWVPRLGYNKPIWAVANRLCRLVWKILHQQQSYIEYGHRANPNATTKWHKLRSGLIRTVAPSRERSVATKREETCFEGHGINKERSTA